MADNAEAGAFRQNALNRIASPDDLDRYLKVSNPSFWIIAGAMLVLVLGLVVWSFAGHVPITMTTVGVCYGDTSVSFWVDEETFEKVQNPDAEIRVGQQTTQELTIYEAPMSEHEVKTSMSSEYTMEGLELYDWNYLIVADFANPVLDIDYSDDDTVASAEHLVPVEIKLVEEHPISLLIGS